jgi:hypothetical protein
MFSCNHKKIEDDYAADALENNLPLADSKAKNLFWNLRLDEDGQHVNTPSDFLKLIGGELKLCKVEWDDDMIWQNLGPFESTTHYQMNQGRVESISQNPRNYQDVLLGSLNGGAWRTTDGGVNWHNTTDDEGLSIVGFHEICRHPKDQNILYAATGTSLDKWNNGQRGYGLGVVMSIDGGEEWTVTGQSPPYGGWLSGLTDVAVDPRSTLDSTILYAANSTSLFRWTGDYKAAGEWDRIYENDTYFSGPAIFGNVDNHDIEIDRYGNVFLCNTLGVYFLKVNRDELQLIESIKIPEERKTIVRCQPDSIQNPIKSLFDLEINKLGHISILANYYYMTESNGKCRVKNGPYFYSVSKDLGITWSDPVNLKTSGYVYPNLAVHQYDSDIFYFEGSSRQVRRSINGGLTNQRIPPNRNHVDVRNLTLMQSKYGDSTGMFDKLYVGNDGGIAFLQNDVWKDITGSGIANTNYFGLAATEQDSEYIFLGAQDGSANFYRNGHWYTTMPGGDNGDCLIDPRDKFHVYQSANGTLQVGRVDSIRWRGRAVKSLVGGVGLFPMLMNPSNPKEVFAGGLALYASSNEGKSWTEIESPHAPIRFNKMAMSQSNPDVLYYVINGLFWNQKAKAADPQNQGGVFKAMRDSLGNWAVTDVTNNLNSKCEGENNCGLPQLLTSVTVDPKNADRLWVSMAGFKAGYKVFYSDDGGMVWENFSDCIPNLPAICIVYDEGSNDGLYLGTDYGVFYKNADMSEWIFYGEQGPKIMVTDMEINNQSNELLISTMGRGLWKVPLYSEN